MNNINRNNLHDRHLVNTVLSGDTHAFGLIMKNTERLVTQIVFKMISSPGDRKDIAQDIYLKAYKKLPHFKFQSKLSTWIAQISYNTCLDYLRKKKLILPGDSNDGNENDDYLLDRINNPSFIPSLATNDLILQKNISAILKKEIAKLSPVYKTLITLYHHEELSYEEIGQITRLPDGTIKNYLFRARKKLRDNLLLNYNKEDL